MSPEKHGASKRGGKKRRARVDQLRIKDGERLRMALRAVAEHLGGVRKAARELGLKDHSTFNRLLTGGISTSMTPRTFETIGGALITYAVRFQDNLVREAAEAFWDAVEDAPWYGLGEVPHRYEEWVEKEFRRLQAVARPVFNEIWKRPEHQRTIAHHLRKATRQPSLPRPNEKRLWVALLRAVEPLSASAATWGVERSWDELTPTERNAFLDHSLLRERIMLEREGELERMALRPPPDEWWDEYFAEIENAPPPAPISPDDPAHLLLELDEAHPTDDDA